MTAFLANLGTFIAALPELLKLWATIQAAMKENQIQLRSKDAAKQIHEHFVANDKANLNKLFVTTVK